MKESSADTWQRIDIAAGISVEFPPGAVTRGEHQGVAYAWHTSSAGTFGVRVGPGQGLGSWRAVFQAAPKLGAAITVTMCGRPVTRQEAAFEAGPYATGVSQDDAGAYVHEATDHPAMTEVAVAFAATDGTPAVATWRVETAARQLHETDATRFFAALRCK
jgi:hypothetical protein